MLYRELGKVLRDARRRMAVTQAQLAERAGVAQADISRFENGNSNPSIRTTERLAEGVGCRLRIEFLPPEEEEPS